MTKGVTALTNTCEGITLVTLHFNEFGCEGTWKMDRIINHVKEIMSETDWKTNIKDMKETIKDLFSNISSYNKAKSCYECSMFNIADRRHCHWYDSYRYQDNQWEEYQQYYAKYIRGTIYRKKGSDKKYK